MNTTALTFNARPSLASITPLLEAADLPTSDLTESHLEHFFTCGPERAPTGLVGLEIYGRDALLRSLVVSASERTKGTGSALVAHIEQYACNRRVGSIYLLTTTADRFFERLGYKRIDRALAPTSIQLTPEFSSICPASSAFMSKPL